MGATGLTCTKLSILSTSKLSKIPIILFAFPRRRPTRGICAQEFAPRLDKSNSKRVAVYKQTTGAVADKNEAKEKNGGEKNQIGHARSSQGDERARREATGWMRSRGIASERTHTSERASKREREARRAAGCTGEREGCHDISLACADSSSFVTVAAINNFAILSLWIIRVGLSLRIAAEALVPGAGAGVALVLCPARLRFAGVFGGVGHTGRVRR